VSCQRAVLKAVEISPLQGLHPVARPVQAAIAVHAIEYRPFDVTRHRKKVFVGVPMYRIGLGYDVHRLVAGRPLVIGGVTIPYRLGLTGHSDADVLAHAIIDSILGALGRGDIGRHFPDTDPIYKDMDSLLILRTVMEWVKQDGLRINNLDSTIIAERPKLAPHIPSMIEGLTEILETQTSQVNIKATTTEGLGFCGRQEGIAAFAVVSLIK
jgi:2-C-methyl-D-erythritol 2,4-cyclodiphosphate synthase